MDFKQLIGVLWFLRGETTSQGEKRIPSAPLPKWEFTWTSNAVSCENKNNTSGDRGYLFSLLYNHVANQHYLTLVED